MRDEAVTERIRYEPPAVEKRIPVSAMMGIIVISGGGGDTISF